MRKLVILVIIFCSYQKIQSQEVYLQTGKNFTNYDYKSNSSNTSILQAGTGDFYEIGYVMTLKNEKFKYAFGLNLNEYNAIAGNTVSSYSWNTQYLGVQNSFSVSLVKKRGFEASANGGFGISTLIYGKQVINGEYFDLSSQKEFSGFWITNKLGVSASYNVDNDIYLSLGYAYSKSFNLSNNTDEKLSFNNNQIQFGVHFTFK